MKASQTVLRTDRVSITLDESGFSLIEVMIAAGMSVLLALGLAEVMRNATTSESRFKVKQELNNLRQEWRYERTMSTPPSPDPS